MGVGPVEDRTYRVMCGCDGSLEGKDRAKFLKELRDNPAMPCYMDCPYQCLCDYMQRIPDPTGQAQEALRAVNPNLAGPPLKLMRARTSFEPRVFIKGNLGINKLREVMPRLNLALPKEMQVCFNGFLSVLSFSDCCILILECRHPRTYGSPFVRIQRHQLRCRFSDCRQGLSPS